MTRPINLDYVSTRGPLMMGLAVFVLALFVVVLGWQRFNTLNQGIHGIDNKIQQLKSTSGIKQSNQTVHEKSSTELLAKMDNAKKLASLLLIPWADLFSALESASLADSALLSIEPDAKKQQLKVTVEAKNKDSMFNYIQRLEATTELSNVYLLKHEILEDVDQHPIRFVVVAHWKDKV